MPRRQGTGKFWTVEPAALSDGEGRSPSWSLTSGLTPSQYEAVTASEAVLCVLAGAGAGKTRVLTLRVARRAHDGSAPARHVLAATFSRKAAGEMRRRLWTLGLGDEVEAGTFHHIALGLVKRHRLDHTAPAPSVLSDRRTVLAELFGPAIGTVQLDTEISWAKARLLSPEDYHAAAHRARRSPTMGSERVADLYGRYERERRHRRLLDFDDLLWSAADLLEHDPRFASAVRWRFRHVYVDEMQDLNPAQFRLLRAVVGDEPDLCAVGDPNQSVYGWNGADPSLIDRLPSIFPGTRVVRLDENHRCTPQVVAVASAALGLDRSVGEEPGDGTGRLGGCAPVSTRPDGPVPRFIEHTTDAAEAGWVARQVWLAHQPMRRWRRIAVLARTNAQLLPIAAALAAERVPYRFAGREWEPRGDLELGTGDDAGDLDGWGDGEAEDDGVVLATFHRAKGLEWPVVFVVGLSDGLVPLRSARTAAAREEERRLLYVALTRAEEELTGSWSCYPEERDRERGKAPRQPSPWLSAVIDTCEAFRLATQSAPADRVAAHLSAIRSQLEAAGVRRSLPSEARPGVTSARTHAPE